MDLSHQRSDAKSNACFTTLRRYTLGDHIPTRAHWATTYPYVRIGRPRTNTCALGDHVPTRAHWATTYPHVRIGRPHTNTCKLGDHVPTRAHWATTYQHVRIGRPRWVAPTVPPQRASHRLAPTYRINTNNVPFATCCDITKRSWFHDRYFCTDPSKTNRPCTSYTST